MIDQKSKRDVARITGYAEDSLYPAADRGQSWGEFWLRLTLPEDSRETTERVERTLRERAAHEGCAVRVLDRRTQASPGSKRLAVRFAIRPEESDGTGGTALSDADEVTVSGLARAACSRLNLPEDGVAFVVFRGYIEEAADAQRRLSAERVTKQQGDASTLGLIALDVMGHPLPQGD